MAIENGRYVCCPMCHGKGQMHRADLVEYLSDPERDQKLQAYLQQITKEEEEAAKTVPDDFEREVHSWPPKRMLWRRSPKE